MTYRTRVAAVFLLGFFLDLINMFIASVAFPAMGQALHAAPASLAWVSNGYIAGLTLVIPFSALLAPACSPALGGLLVQTLGWRWVFFVTLPVSAVTFALAWLWLSDEKPEKAPSRLLHLPLLKDPLLRFSMLVYLCVPGMFIGVNVVGMFYLQSVAGLTPAETGLLMLPWSLASFVAITATGRYFNRTGPRPLIALGCLLQAAGILLLMNVGPETARALAVLAFTLMGIGGSLCSSTAQSSAFLTIPHAEMPDASALWNLNRQLSFFMGALLLAELLSLAQGYLPPSSAWRWTFIFAAGVTLLPLLRVFHLNNPKILMRIRQEKP